MTNAAFAAPDAAPPQPLFYRAPVVLHSAVHGAWRLKPGDLSFAAGAAYVPVVLGEFDQACCCYPVVFTGDTGHPVAVLGLNDGQNLFVEHGVWAAGQYVPAYVRRYPFNFAPVPGSERFALVIDAAPEWVTEDEGEGAPLFENGEPGAVTRQALQFCEAWQADFAGTEAFVQALRDRDLLVEKRADATLPDGRRYALDGFRMVDPERLQALDDATVVDWHRRGWLSRISLHLASIGRFAALLDRQGQLA